ncbi:hypothetical protein SAMN04487995_0408 [Dyadobacter koreensis]|uniref:Uncharacterized protein n=1 Tax=Dyadobacter koreensis TaxID=408657 RepID=A0A1H6QKW2_9BACT|nr:hypothetical protein SAMN04487995_0408 [Dyadobacter koreensis]
MFISGLACIQTMLTHCYSDIGFNSYNLLKIHLMVLFSKYKNTLWVYNKVLSFTQRL